MLQARCCSQKVTNLIDQSTCLCCTWRVPTPLQPELSRDAELSCALSQQAAREGWAVAVSLEEPHRRERRDSRGAPHCTAWAVYLFSGWESHPGLPNPSAVPLPQHRNMWKGLNLVLNVTWLCKSQGCNAVQKQAENTVWFQPSE